MISGFVKVKYESAPTILDTQWDHHIDFQNIHLACVSTGVAYGSEEDILVRQIISSTYFFYDRKS